MSFRNQRGGNDPFSTKTSRHERFAQMSQQERLIEQKKRELLEKLAQKQKAAAESAKAISSSGLPSSSSGVQSVKQEPAAPILRRPQWRGLKLDPKWKRDGGTNSGTNKPATSATTTSSSSSNNHSSTQSNLFLNDGSFLDHFKKVTEGKGAIPIKEERPDHYNRDHQSNRASSYSATSLSSGDRWRNKDYGRDTHRESESGRTEHLASSQHHYSREPPPMSKPARAPSPYSPSRVSPDSSPQAAPSSAPSFPPTNVPPPNMIHRGPDLSQPPPIAPMMGTKIPSGPPPPIIPPLQMNMPLPPVLMQTNIPPPSVPITQSTMPSMQTMVNIPPPAMMTSQPPPPLLQGMSVPPPNMATPPPALPASMQQLPQFPFTLPSGPPPTIPLSSTAPPVPTIPPTQVTGPPVSIPPPLPSIPPPTLTSFPPPVPAATVTGNVSEVSPTAVPTSSNFTLTAAIAQLARMVAEGGEDIEEMARERNRDDPTMWFLYQKESAAYNQYRNLVQRIKAAKNPDLRRAIEIAASAPKRSGETMESNFAKKRRSRWGDKISDSVKPPEVLQSAPGKFDDKPGTSGQPLLTKVTRTDPKLLAYAQKAFGSINLSDEDWKKCEDHYKVHLLYHDMLRKREQLAKLQRAGRNKYEYDSDEDVDGGTWEHKLRSQEMEATERWADELTKQAEGKHHIGDFLPPTELSKFMEKYNARKEGREPDLSDYKEYKLKEDNVGFKMLQKLGWSEGQGLGSEGQGITTPVNKATVRADSQGLGIDRPEEVGGNDDEYEAYRKRMMLAYRFRPNPLNNPRRSYY